MSIQKLFKEMKQHQNKKIKLTWQQVTVIALCFIIDIGDYFGLAIPYLGDIADAFLILILTRYFGKKAWIANTIQSFEMLPGADFLPLSIIAAITVMYWEYKGKEVMSHFNLGETNGGVNQIFSKKKVQEES